MKSDKTIMYIIEFLLLIASLCFVIFTDFFTKTVIAIVLFFFMIISNRYIISFKAKGRYERSLTKVMIGIAVAYLAAIYVLGIYIGFYNSTVTFSKWSLFNYIIPYIFIIIFSENIRKTIMLKDDKKAKIFLLISFVIMDIALTTNIFSVAGLMDYFMLIGFVIFSSIANNLLYNYISSKLRNSNAIIIYRIILTIYVYIIPIVPNLHILFESIIKMIIPYLIYILLEAMYSKSKQEVSTQTKTKEIIVTSIALTFSIGILMLVSCKFTYGALVIGSGSMTGTINKGDVIIYKTLEPEEKDDIKVGDIIVFYSNDVRVIHRVIGKKEGNNGYCYYTQGDANPNEDDGYRIEDDIIGKVNLRLPYLGQVTILINDLFK